MSDAHFIREPHPDDPAATPGPEMMIMIEGDGEAAPRVGKDGAVEVELADGGLAIYPHGLPQKESSTDFDANLAEDIEAGELSRISEELLTGIESDVQSRSEWIEARSKGLTLLGLKLEAPKAGAADAGGPMQGVSVVRSPLLLEAVLRFQANAGAELLPSGGPVKVKNDTPPKTKKEAQAQNAALAVPVPGEGPSSLPQEAEEDDVLGECLEREFNHYLTAIDKEYYADFRRMLFYTGFGGSGFRKVYYDPLKRRPVSRAIDADDLIVADPEVSLHDCGRVTHKIPMRQSVLRRMQLAGQYRDISLAPPVETGDKDDAVDKKENELAGINPVRTLPGDHKHTIFECYCELDIAGHEHKEDGKGTGLPLPYRVTIDQDSREVLDIRRNWREGDDNFQPRMPIVKFPFVEGLSFYGIGLLHILGNSTAAVTATWRLALDAGMMASYPAFLYSDQVSRQTTNVFRLTPNAGVRINTGGMPIQDVVMPAPFHDATPGLLNMMQHIEENAGRVGGVAELQVGEGRQDAPVGTTIAMLDQATKVMAGVHKGLHAAQAEEFALLVELFKQYPDALIAQNKKPSRQWQREELIDALENNNLVPQADPNTPSHTVRVMRAVALLQLYQMNPQAWVYVDLVKRITRMVGEDDIQPLLAPPMPPNQQPDPLLIMAQAKVLDSQSKSREVDLKAASADRDYQLQAAKLQTSRDVANANVTRDLIIHQGELAAQREQTAVNAHQTAADRALEAQQGAVDANQNAAGMVLQHHQHQTGLAADHQQHTDKMRDGVLDKLLQLHIANQRPQGRVL